MKQIAKLTGLIVLMVVLASPAWAKGPAGVANTVHNLSSGNLTLSNYTADNLDEVCAFCHTPHGGVLNGPLWNRSLPDAGSFTHYNSATVSSYLQGLSVSRNVSDESLICMSCHDGSVAVDHLINDPNSLNGAPITILSGNTDVEIVAIGGDSVGARIGAAPGNTGATGILSDDHPISFSYSQVLAEYNGGSRAGELREIGPIGDTSTALGWKGEGVRFFGADNRVECSSCHDVHVDEENNAAYAPFLIRPNTGSDLCLACHNK